MTRALALLVALAAPLGAQTPLSETARQALGLTSDAAAEAYARAWADALAFRLDDADAGFAEVRRAAPEAPAGLYGQETVALWRAFVLEEDDVFDRFYALNDSLQALADDLAGRPDAPPAGALVGATAKLHRALALGRQERYTRAGPAFREACGRFRDVSVADATYGQGVCEVAAGSVPRKYRWLGRLLGFRGDVAGGLAKLDAASQADGALAVDATVAFAIADATLNERRSGSVGRLVALAEAHPDSPVLAYLAGYHLLIDRQGDAAEAALRRAQEGLSEDGVQPLPFVEAHLGLALFRQHRFEEAAETLESFARTFRGRALVALATLHAGIAREMAGDRRRAEANYRRVRASRDYDTDQASAREAARRLEGPMTEAERALVLGGSAYDGGRYDEAVRHLQPVVTGADLPAVVRAEAAYRTGRAYQAQERWADALRHFQLATDRPGDPLARWGPWAEYHAGEVFEAQGQLGEARQRYDAVLDNEDEFDYHKSLEQRARAALERVR